MKWLRNHVGDIPLFSIIVFSDRCELKKVTVYSDDVKVVKRYRTYATVREIWEKNADAAIEQIKNKHYHSVLEDYFGEIILVGINYDSETDKHTCVIEKIVK